MGTNGCSQPASKSSWDSQDFGDVNKVLKMAHFHKSSRPQWVNFRKNPQQILLTEIAGTGIYPSNDIERFPWIVIISSGSKSKTAWLNLHAINVWLNYYIL